MKDTLQLVLQCGALGLLAVLFYGTFRIAVVYAPIVKEFLVGLLTVQSTLLQQNAAFNVKLDEVKADVANLHRAVERARDDVLAAKSSPRPSVVPPSGGVPSIARAARAGG